MPGLRRSDDVLPQVVTYYVNQARPEGATLSIFGLRFWDTGSSIGGDNLSCLFSARPASATGAEREGINALPEDTDASERCRGRLEVGRQPAKLFGLLAYVGSIPTPGAPTIPPKKSSNASSGNGLLPHAHPASCIHGASCSMDVILVIAVKRCCSHA